jgi:ribosomal protein S18 acetylase RimI-like enzyme
MVFSVAECTENYWEFVRALRTDDRVLDGFIQRGQITPEQQSKYMIAHAHEYLIGLVDGKPAGFVGSVDDDIRVCTHPDYQKSGLGKFMVRELMRKFPSAFAKIKVGNEASKRLFEACGFKPVFEIYVASEHASRG